MRSELQFWFEFASTYSYPAAMRIEAQCAGAGVQLCWRPFLLGPIFAAQGWNDSPFNIYPSKGHYMWRDLERICMRAGLPLRRPTQFPRNSLLAARVACAAADAAWLPGFVRAVYHANFAEDRDIAAPAVLADVLARLGVPAEPILAAAQSSDVKQRLRAHTDEAMRRGIFGAPSFTVGEELFWGNDRLEDALAWQRTPADRVG
jgi:2-hydroxychromene-2-carboxylate isomerase